MDELKPVEVRSSSIHAQGAFATRDFAKGERIMEYLGERIDAFTAGERYDDDNMPRHHTFLFGLSDGQYIDAGVDGNEARYINHSCDPNCKAEEEDGRIYIYAKKKIKAGEELTYDYRLERDGKRKKSWNKLYACHCGSKNCRGTMLAPLKKKKKKKH